MTASSSALRKHDVGARQPRMSERMGRAPHPALNSDYMLGKEEEEEAGQAE